MLMGTMNYAKLLERILKIGINDRFINYAGQGDIYQINVLDVKDYPIFWISATQPMTEHNNYIDYNLTLYYVDREKFQNDDVNDTDQPLIHSNGMMVLGNIINKIKFEFKDEMLNELGDIQYTLWSETEIFSDKCAGVYTNITISLPKLTNCPVD